MMEMLTFREVEIPRTAMVSMTHDELQAMLSEEFPKPWIVESSYGQMLAYGPWKVTGVESRTMGASTTFTIMRGLVRRSDIRVNKDNLPHGRVWRVFPPAAWVQQGNEGVINLP
jgi:hypothetical protein